jgi:hypothetical protein
MELRHSQSFLANNWRCEFRSLQPEDVSPHYIKGLTNDSPYILGVPDLVTVESQQAYINQILSSRDDSINGLFVSGKLIGTSGTQLSVDFVKFHDGSFGKLNNIGIFIFDPGFRGVGFGKTLVWAATYCLHASNNTYWFAAGMKRDNTPSLMSFLSSGYKQIRNEEESVRVMLNFAELKAPKFVTDISLNPYDAAVK